jgi:hypothetical protein
MSKIEVNQISSQCGSTLTIGQSGDTVTLAAGATQTGFGRTGTVDWDTTAKTASFTAVSGNGYFVNTTSGAITVTLPAGSAGSIVSLKDYANTWNTNKLTITPNGTDKINGVNENAVLNTADQSVTLVYVDSTKGWRAVQDSTSGVTGGTFITATGGTITTCGNCKIHTFTGPGTFCVSCVSSCAANNRVSYMVVAGGGSGGGGYQAGGGGAGGFREDKSPVTPYTASPLDGAGPITVTASPYPITVGGGGAAQCTPLTKGNSGSNSVFSTITSAGGGGAGTFSPCSPTAAGISGGSGGGAGHIPGGAPGGAGNTPPVSPSQGNNGGATGNPYCHPYPGGGGGGATAAGSGGAGGTGSCNGCGGNGATTSISGGPTAYAGGGGGGGYGNPYTCSTTIDSGDGGTGGGGKGSYGPTGAVSGTTNRGGGGGGASGPWSATSGAGGSGIVIIRYKYQ